MKPFPSGVLPWLLGVALLGPVSPATGAGTEPKPIFQAGAFAIDITPTDFPVIVNAMFEERSATNAVDPLHARCLALDDGRERLVIAVVDSCMLPRDLLDEAKRLASSRTGLPVDRMLVSATHTHSAPSAMGCLGSRVDPQYARYLPGRIAEGIERAIKNLAPARVGWGAVDDYEHTHCRRWIRRPDRLLTDPFGDKNVRANMHPGHQSPDAIGPSGPVDPALSLVAVQTPEGKPIAVLANYSMHYYESPLVSSDYYGRFPTKLAQLIGAQGGNGPFVGIMSQGTSGDQMWMDYGKPLKKIGLDAYAQEVAEVAAEAYRRIEFHDWVPLAMREAKLTLGFRVPDEARLEWARGVVAKIRDGVPRGMAEIYAREAIYLHDRPTAELVMQAIRIGDLGLAAIPDEVFAITGLKIKAQSPFPTTFNIELANGSEGYIPPPEQHALGGYTTWPARTAGLETNAEPKIAEQALRLLEQVAGKPRRPVSTRNGPYAEAVLAAKPASYWRLNEFNGPTALDATGQGHEGLFEGGTAFYLEGPASSAFSNEQINRAPNLAGGRLNSRQAVRGDTYSLEIWFWNGLPAEARALTGYLFSLGPKRDRLFIGGAAGQAGHLQFSVGRLGKAVLTGTSFVRPKTWHHLVLVRSGKEATAYLDGRVDLQGELEPGPVNDSEPWLVGGSPENEFNFEGKIDEVARYDSPLSATDVAKHFQLAGLPAASPTLASVPPEPNGAYPEAVLGLKPLAYWRLADTEAAGRRAGDASGHGIVAAYEENIELHQPGPQAQNFSGGETNHAVQFTGGRLKAVLAGLGSAYSVSLWFWNELPNDDRPVTGYLFSRGQDGAEGAPGDHLGIGGTHEHHEGRLFFFNGNKLNEVLVGNTVLEPRSWNNAVLVRNHQKVTVYLNGQARPEVIGEAAVGIPESLEQIFVGGRNDNFANFLGRIDEVAVFNHELRAEDAASLYRASGLPTKPLAQPASPPDLSSPARSPAESQASIQVPEGFELQLVAAEPLVQSPVAIDWGADGKLWVVEMADYPMGLDGKMKSGGRVRYLEDTDGDGRYDKSTVFMEGVNFPNGIITWRHGVIVTAAPDIFYAEDTDGDGRADKREVLFTGFAEGNTQLRVNGLRWGIDNWLYCANGWSGGVVRSLKTGAQFELGRRDLRIRPDDGLIELQSGQTEFGRNRDDWGNWFGCDNSYPLFHFVLDDHYLRRNPHVPAPEAKRQLLFPSNPRVYARSRPQKRYHSFEHATAFTAACSTDFYRDELLFPRGAVQHAFVCEPVHNLIHQMIVREDGATFSASRAKGEEESEFLASDDQWFRPVMVRTGPDGALWVVDMYRYMIEHPDWLPPEGKKELQPFYRTGAERGRIYRLVPKGGKLRPIPRFDQLDTAGLVKLLESPNGWQRDQAQQILFWRADRAAVGPLENLTANSSSALARLHALGALEGLGALKPAQLERGLRDEAPGVRRFALRLAETRVGETPTLLEAAVKLVDDPDAKVRQQLAYSLGEWTDPRAGEALGRLAVANAQDPYITAAVLSSALHHCSALARHAVEAGASQTKSLWEPLLGLSLALQERDSLALLLQPVLAVPASADWAGQMRLFRQFLEALAHRKVSTESLISGHEDALAQLLKRAPGFFATARQIAPDSKQALPERVAAAHLLGRDPSRRTEDLELLGKLLGLQAPHDVQQAAIGTLGQLGDSAAPGLWFKAWSSLGPDLLLLIVDECLGRESWTMAMLQSVESGQISLLNLDAARRERLLKHSSEKVRLLAKKLLAAGATNPDRQKIIDDYAAALTLPGNAINGTNVFARLCSLCHQLNGVGREIGPNLLSVATHPPERLVISILDPSREVQSAYLAYQCALTDGTELYGLIASETGNSITMKMADDTQRTLLRSEIQSLQSARVSLMPEGLEAGMTPQELADLIAYLRTPARQK